MKILNKYRFIRGAKGGDAPIPALVPPPKNQDLLKSISIYQGIDALCEGPIYGLVDQFGKKIYGLDMLKGIYLNKVPAMNFAGEANFNKIYIYKPANFKLLGKIDPNEQDIRPNGTPLSNPRVERRNFSDWAMGAGWPSQPQDPFVYVHHIRNKDVKKIQVAFVIEQLSDTVSEGEDKGKAGKMGMSKRTRMELMIRYGIEGSKTFSSKRVIIDGLVLSPYSYMVGEETSTVDGAAGSFGNPATLGGSVFNTAATPSVNTSKDSRLLNALSSEEVLRRMMYQEAQ
jgi:hypothetical protein